MSNIAEYNFRHKHYSSQRTTSVCNNGMTKYVSLFDRVSSLIEAIHKTSIENINRKTENTKNLMVSLNVKIYAHLLLHITNANV